MRDKMQKLFSYIKFTQLVAGLGLIFLASCSQAITTTPTSIQSTITTTSRATSSSTSIPGSHSITGTGNSTLGLRKPDNRPILAHIKCEGADVTVISYTANKEPVDPLVMKTGKYEGTVIIDGYGGQKTEWLQISCDSQWEIQVIPLDAIRGEIIPTTFKGNGDDVIYIQGYEKPDLLKLDASQAEKTFMIRAFGGKPEILVAGWAPYTGTIKVPSDCLDKNGGVILAIMAEGDWSIEVITK
jgi:hypothetical protein